MKVPCIRRLVDYWPSTFYTGCVLQAPGYADVIKFKDLVKTAFEKALKDRDGPALGWQEGVTSEEQEKEMWDEIENGMKEEIELKMSPFRESHPTASCYKHHCSLLQCEVLQDSSNFLMFKLRCYYFCICPAATCFDYPVEHMLS